ncbi:MAG: Signal recognition particle 54 kDa protein [Candidatus Methanofastidiosum methylothiophilum]|uniref:Signal recognition particle receptor FtsY n=1 Tax=Candidatus Methanofastidiosum methylothiophilum TaxID=1705564 RepID=A0A150IV71_9EURY|nr:MAG: Signal recognition particle 54 kDa protein [Candidatus Methanofastidiosum methylthiophilus]KYC47348.1 MAG: Signal recognition particle 54 kDa protein [Candidatus Methanofastidiosum methylthiophilus]KYC48873.1 MAG: Signal recognition particle 54 kDa protein [Candidatus Methanofastidiosum methylthiophilus]
MFDSLKNKFSGLVDGVSSKKITEKDLDKILEDFELSLLESDVSLKVSEKIVNELKKKLTGEKIGLTSNKKDFVKIAVEETLTEILEFKKYDVFKEIEKKRKAGEIFSIAFVGFNGTGKTTSIAKFGKLLLDKGYKVVIAASDTFRAGSIEQLSLHAENIGIKVIKHNYGADPAAVAFDAISHAKARGIDVVLIDTAGRSEMNRNLMDEMKKLVRVANPDMKIFVGDSLAGNAVAEQAEKFSDIGLDGSILTKVDADSRGGAALSISYITGKPILFIGTGQGYDDLEPFDPKWLVERILP